MGISINLEGIHNLASRVNGEGASTLNSLLSRPGEIAGGCQSPGSDFTSPEVVSTVKVLSEEMQTKISDISQRLADVSSSLNVVHDSFAGNEVDATTAVS